MLPVCDRACPCVTRERERERERGGRGRYGLRRCVRDRYDTDVWDTWIQCAHAYHTQTHTHTHAYSLAPDYERTLEKEQQARAAERKQWNEEREQLFASIHELEWRLQVGIVSCNRTHVFAHDMLTGANGAHECLSHRKTKENGLDTRWSFASSPLHRLCRLHF